MKKQPVILLQRLLILFVLLFCSVGFAKTDPRIMLESIATKMTHTLDKNREHLLNNKTQVHDLIKKELLPYIDKMGLGRRVLGNKVWRHATQVQKEKFIHLFIHLIITTYADGLLKYNGERFEFNLTEYSNNGKIARVTSAMKQNHALPVQIDYTLKIPKGLQDWRVIDVTIEGVSMVLSYRSQFKEYLKQHSLEHLLDALSKGHVDLKDDLKLK